MEKSMERLLNKTKIVDSFTRASIELAFVLFVLCKHVDRLGCDSSGMDVPPVSL